MRQFYFLILLLSFSFFNNSYAQQGEYCASEILFKQAAAKDPSLLLKRREVEEFTKNYLSSKKNQRIAAETIRIIPVVFHVIHEGGPENISKAQIEDQIRILNEDFRRLNPDTVNTPAPFKHLGADCKIEFRLAKKDPKGNCTDGIVRVFSHRTNEANDTIKALSVWDNSRYLNIWVVKSLYKLTKGSLLGYAQFPNSPMSNSKDGVMIVASTIGSIGTAKNNHYQGRVATHEIGHWLNLIHIWGDDECGNDQVEDTPFQKEENSGCPTFPHFSCGDTINGDMFSNYMDYSNGECENIFTKGQKVRMDATLAGYRTKLVSSANLIFTGVDDASPVTVCAPKAAFTSAYRTVCTGDSIAFFDASYNGTPTQWLWTFEGGSPSTSTLQNPKVKYNTIGNFKVSLTATNSTGSSSYTFENMIYARSIISNITAPYAEGFESAIYPNNDWLIINDDKGPTWTKTTQASYSGSSSMMISNFKGNNAHEVEELIGPVMDLSSYPSPKMTFRVAYGQKDSAYQDELKVLVSIDCGKVWYERYVSRGNTLASGSGGLQYVNYVPKSKAEWKLQTVPLIVTASQSAKVRLKFVFTSAAGNNIYIDDISINKDAVGIDDALNSSEQLSVYPNPLNEGSVISFSLTNEQTAAITVFDVMGREISSPLKLQKLASGDHTFSLGKQDVPGVYFIRLLLNGKVVTKKVISE